MAYSLANFARSVLQADLSASTDAGQSITLAAAAAPLQNPAAATDDAPGTLVLLDTPATPTKIEIVTYTGVSIDGNAVTLTGVSREQEGTTAQAWPAGTPVYQGVTAGVIADVQASIAALADAVAGKADKDSDVTFTGAVTIAPGKGDAALALESADGNAGVSIDAPAGTNRCLTYQSSGKTRWRLLAAGDEESGNNTGSHFAIQRFDDDGNYVENVFSIARNTGTATFAGGVNADWVDARQVTVGSNSDGAAPIVYRDGSTNSLAARVAAANSGYVYFTFGENGNFNVLNGSGVFAGTVQANQAFCSNRNTVILGCGSSGTVYLRPNGINNSTGQMTVDQHGLVRAADFQSASDARLKTDVKLLRRGIDELKRMLPREYVKGGRKEVGIIAQEVREVLPEAVSENEEGFLTVSYGQVVALLARAILDLDERLTARAD